MCTDEIKFTGIKLPCVPFVLPFNGFLISRYIPEVKKRMRDAGLTINQRINIIGGLLK